MGLEILTKGFKNLEHCDLHIYNMTWRESDWVPFLVNHPHIKMLTLHAKASHVVNDDVLIAIAGTIKNLEYLYLSGCNNVSFKGLLVLEKVLRCFHAEWMGASFTSELAAVLTIFNSLE